ncbi:MULTISPECIES: hypothetical protein [unclassified Solwaraspora]|uniref:hypothetical protein n=1 Tax=unclassified Solwaraspora TaxID=2627926 RepID=UPI00248D1744|nr:MULTISPECIES: hypothetical protein [unclassified Solwaraspora]WBB97306.1 hypothetical protein O7553_29395 [Solwaraspora sp. WMMA2059]WBB97420.1 hypothetical protein O7553_30085 [Solwaraspora sp. WMMA2059]WBC18792.1 hypothetical protein O7543_17965 [Solwaraspora sp. WMMA2080]WJK33802.1 hypothetical protein O7610_24560 [Solwaraspora sp. WMMA2065]
MSTVSPDAAEGFYRLVDAAYERRSLAVSSNLHYAHVVVIQGDSFRLNQATTGQRVKLLN